jgi:hypothetical protein
VKRIDTATAEADTNGAGKDGFTNGVPGVTPATVVDADWFNYVQEEICNVMALAGVAIDGSYKNQMAGVLRDDQVLSAEYSIDAVTGTTAGDVLALTALREDTGFSETAGAITVPGIGLYRVTVDGLGLLTSAATNPANAGIEVRLNGTIIGTCRMRRYNTNTSEYYPISGTFIVAVTDAAYTFDVRSEQSGTGVNHDGNGASGARVVVSVTRLRDAQF